MGGSTHLLQLYQGNQRREMCPPPSPTTGDHLEGQWHLKGSSPNPCNLNRVSALMIIFYAGSCSRWSGTGWWSGGWSVVTVCWGTDTVSLSCWSICPGRWPLEQGEYGVSSLIVPKVSSSRRTTQGCAIYTWSTLNAGQCLPYLLITIRVDMTIMVDCVDARENRPHGFLSSPWKKGP